MSRFQYLFLSSLFLSGCAGPPQNPVASPSPDSGIPTLNYSVRHVRKNGTPLDSLNELEYIKGYIYANRFTQNYIVKIDPTNGHVIGKLDLTSLVNEERNRNPGTDVLNGIAYDPGADMIYVTGKLWSRIYEIDFSH